MQESEGEEGRDLHLRSVRALGHLAHQLGEFIRREALLARGLTALALRRVLARLVEGVGRL